MCRRDDGQETTRLIHAHSFAPLLGLDMRKCFPPTAENYFSRIGKEDILTSLQESRTVLPEAAEDPLSRAERDRD